MYECNKQLDWEFSNDIKIFSLNFLEKGTLPFENLLISSSWGNVGGGYSGVMLTGYKTATMLLKINKYS